MFNLFKKKSQKEKAYSIGDLYVASIGVVTRQNNVNYVCSSELAPKEYIIVSVTRDGTYPQAKSPINGAQYGFFHDCRGILADHIGEVMVYATKPLALIVNDKTELTMSEIIAIENQLNNPSDKIEAPKELTNTMLNQIMLVANKAKNVIDDEKRSSIITQLNLLANDYVYRMIALEASDNDGTLTSTDPKADLNNECLNRLVQIEMTVDESLKSNGLLTDLNILQRKLNNKGSN